MKKYILYSIIILLTPVLHAANKSIEWVHEVDRKVLEELDASSGDYTSLEHHLEYVKKIKLGLQLSGVIYYAKDRGYCVYELTSNKRYIVLASFGKKEGRAKITTGLKKTGNYILRNLEDKKTEIHFILGDIYEIVDENYTISVTSKNLRNTQIYKGLPAKKQAVNKILR